MRFNPLQIENDRLYVSLGLMKRMEVRCEDIAEVIEDRAILEKKLTKNTIDFVARDFEKTYPDVILKLKHPTEVTLLMGVKKKYEQVAIRVDEQVAIRVDEQVAIKVDEPEKFKQLLKDKLQNQIQ